MIGLETKRWGATAWLAATSQVGESRMFVFDYAIRGLRVAVLLSIWVMLLRNHPGASPLPLEALLTYTVLAEAFAHTISLRSGLADAFWQGTLVNYFLRPMGVVRQFAAESAGRAAVDFVLFSLPLLALAALFEISIGPHSTAGSLGFVLSLVLSVAAGLALEFIAGAVALVSDQPIWLVENVRRSVTRLLSGAVLPLAILPFGLDEWLQFLPFAATAWAPLAIYTGMGDPASLLALQAFWVAVLWPIALSLWARNRERVVSYGG